MSVDAFKQRGQSIESAYFKQQNEAATQAYRQKQNEETCRNYLRALMNVHDDDIIHQAYQLGIRPENVTALTYIPLVHVAWADSVVEKNERLKILDFIKEDGIQNNSHITEMVTSWLDSKPNEAFFTLWKNYFHGLRESMPGEDFLTLKENVKQHCFEIAKASGLLGIPSVSRSEKEVLKDIEDFIDQKA